MMFAELDPLMGPPARRAALAGLAKLALLDHAEWLIELVRDPRRSARDRAHALVSLPRLSPSLGISVAASMVCDSADAVRRAAHSVLHEHRSRIDSGREPDAVC